MFKSWLRHAGITLFLIAISSNSVNAQDKADREKTPLKEMQQTFLLGSFPEYAEFGLFSHFTKFDDVQTTRRVESQQELAKQLKSFSKDLLSSLKDPKDRDHEATVKFFAMYTGMARYRYSPFSDRERLGLATRSLEPHFTTIRNALTACLSSPHQSIQFYAAVTLLNFDDHDTKANAICSTLAEIADDELRSDICKLIELGDLHMPSILAGLKGMLTHHKRIFRQQATHLLISIGPAARELIPELITFYQTGPDANGGYLPPLTINIPEECNLALRALESMNEFATPAIPVLIERFAKSSEAEKITILSIFIRTRCHEESCLKVIRKAMQSDSVKLSLTATCAFLQSHPNDAKSKSRIKEALTSEKTRKEAFEVFNANGPAHREFVPFFISLLNHEDNQVRTESLNALAHLGPLAEEAIPAIERRIANDKTLESYDFTRGRSAIIALSKIRGPKAVEALLRLIQKDTDVTIYSIIYLPELKVDLPPNVLPLLMKLIKRDFKRDERISIMMYEISSSNPLTALAIADKMAVFREIDASNAGMVSFKNAALGCLIQLGERATPYRRELEPLKDSLEIGAEVRSALRMIPESVNPTPTPRADAVIPCFDMPSHFPDCSQRKKSFRILPRRHGGK